MWFLRRRRQEPVHGLDECRRVLDLRAVAAAVNLEKLRADDARRELAHQRGGRGLVERARHDQRRISYRSQYRSKVEPGKRQARGAKAGRVRLGERMLA